MAKKLYGIINKPGRWVFYPDGKLMAFDDVRIAFASMQRLLTESAGAPFQVMEIGDNGNPAPIETEPEVKRGK